jgi:hypothetical protein
MIQKFKIFFLSLFLFASTTNFNCSQECVAALADLVTEVAFQGTVTIVAGTTFDVPSAIDNVLNTVETCKGDIIETLSAGNSQSRMKVDYDASGNGSYTQNEADDNFSVPAINGGQTALQNYGVLFSEPGDYRLITFCDDKADIEERDENNNASADEYVQAGKATVPARQALYVKVLPNPNYVKPAGQPNAQIVSYSVKIIN